MVRQYTRRAANVVAQASSSPYIGNTILSENIYQLPIIMKFQIRIMNLLPATPPSTTSSSASDNNNNSNRNVRSSIAGYSYSSTSTATNSIVPTHLQRPSTQRSQTSSINYNLFSPLVLPMAGTANTQTNGCTHFSLSVNDTDGAMSVEELARAIESEYKQRSGQNNFVCAALFRGDEQPLLFSSRVRDVLQPQGDTINVYSSIMGCCVDEQDEDMLDEKEIEDEMPAASELLSDGDMGRVSELLARAPLKSRFINVLTHPVLLRGFLEFSALPSELALESILFILDVERFRHVQPSLARLLANYIYLSYVAHNAPLRVNASAQMRDRVPWPFLPGWDYNPWVFDEILASVGFTLKKHTLLRFERSPVGLLALMDCPDFVPEEYVVPLTFDAEYDPMAAVAEMFEPDIDVIIWVNELEFEVPEGSNQLVANLGDLSHNFKQELLERVTSQFVGDESLAISMCEGYFKLATHIRPLQKQRKIKKTRKIKNFFGDNPHEALLRQQLMSIVPPSAHYSAARAAVELMARKKTHEAEQRSKLELEQKRQNALLAHQDATHSDSISSSVLAAEQQLMAIDSDSDIENELMHGWASKAMRDASADEETEIEADTAAVPGLSQQFGGHRMRSWSDTDSDFNSSDDGGEGVEYINGWRVTKPSAVEEEGGEEGEEEEEVPDEDNVASKRMSRHASSILPGNDQTLNRALSMIGESRNDLLESGDNPSAEEDDDNNSSNEDNQSPRTSFHTVGSSTLFRRKRRADKLRDFFGRSDAELQQQQQQKKLSFSTSTTAQMFPLDVSPSIELTAEQRNVLVRRHRKLRAILGEQAEEGIASVQHTSTKTVVSDEEIDNRPAQAMSPSSNSNDSSDNDDELRDAQIRQFAKIREVLGDAAPAPFLYKVSGNSLSNTPTTKDPALPFVTDDQQRERARWRRNKLMTMLGGVPKDISTNYYTDSKANTIASSQPRSRRRGRLPVVEDGYYSAQVSDVEDDTASVLAVSSSTVEQEMGTYNKGQRRRKAKKLRHFFGQSLTSDSAVLLRGISHPSMAMYDEEDNKPPVLLPTKRLDTVVEEEDDSPVSEPSQAVPEDGEEEEDDEDEEYDDYDMTDGDSFEFVPMKAPRSHHEAVMAEHKWRLSLKANGGNSDPMLYPDPQTADGDDWDDNPHKHTRAQFWMTSSPESQASIIAASNGDKLANNRRTSLIASLKARKASIIGSIKRSAPTLNGDLSSSSSLAVDRQSNRGGNRSRSSTQESGASESSNTNVKKPMPPSALKQPNQTKNKHQVAAAKRGFLARKMGKSSTSLKVPGNLNVPPRHVTWAPSPSPIGTNDMLPARGSSIKALSPLPPISPNDFHASFDRGMALRDVVEVAESIANSPNPSPPTSAKPTHYDPYPPRKRSAARDSYHQALSSALLASHLEHTRAANSKSVHWFDTPVSTRSSMDKRHSRGYGDTNGVHLPPSIYYSQLSSPPICSPPLPPPAPPSSAKSSMDLGMSIVLRSPPPTKPKAILLSPQSQPPNSLLPVSPRMSLSHKASIAAVGGSNDRHQAMSKYNNIVTIRPRRSQSFSINRKIERATKGRRRGHSIGSSCQAFLQIKKEGAGNNEADVSAVPIPQADKNSRRVKSMIVSSYQQHQFRQNQPASVNRAIVTRSRCLTVIPLRLELQRVLSKKLAARTRKSSLTSSNPPSMLFRRESSSMRVINEEAEEESIEANVERSRTSSVATFMTAEPFRTPVSAKRLRLPVATTMPIRSNKRLSYQIPKTIHWPDEQLPVVSRSNSSPGRIISRRRATAIQPVVARYLSSANSVAKRPRTSGSYKRISLALLSRRSLVSSRAGPNGSMDGRYSLDLRKQRKVGSIYENAAIRRFASMGAASGNQFSRAAVTSPSNMSK